MKPIVLLNPKTYLLLLLITIYPYTITTTNDRPLPESAALDSYPLHKAVVLGSNRIVKGLIYSGYYDINGSDDQGRVPLHLAAITGQRKMVELLLSLEAETYVKDDAGVLPETYALQAGHVAIGRLLCEWRRLEHLSRDTASTDD